MTYRISEAGSDVEAVTEWAPGDRPGTVRLVRVEVVAKDGAELSAEDLRRIPLSIARASMEALLLESMEQDEEIQSLKVVRPDGSRDWYLRFAAVFMHARTVSTSPAVLIAETNGYKISAVHRWTANARKYGFLPADVRSR
jgi:hypothetical protein